MFNVFRKLKPSIILSLFLLTGCVRNLSPDLYSSIGVGEAALTYSGRVKSVRLVTVREPQNGAGAVAGGIIGAHAGSAVGRGSGSGWSGLAGAIAGAVAGAGVERNITRQKALEYVVQLDDGRMMTVVQGVGRERQLDVGQRAYVMERCCGRSRVVAER